jgi:hypothetical protein
LWAGSHACVREANEVYTSDMDNQLQQFVQQARAKHLSDAEIHKRLLSAGWADEAARQALGDDLVTPLPPSAQSGGGKDSQALLSRRDETVRMKLFVFNMFTVTMWITAIAMFFIVNILLFNETGVDFDVVKFPFTMLIVSAPLMFVFLYMTRANEKKDPELRHVASRVHAVQGVLTLAFLVMLGHTIFFVYQLINQNLNPLQHLTSWLITMVLFGSIFAYYWTDSRKSVKSR